MSYRLAQAIMPRLICGDISLPHAIRWILQSGKSDVEIRNNIAVVSMVDRWSTTQFSELIELGSRSYRFRDDLVTQVSVDGLLLPRSNGGLFWVLMRKNSGLLHELEFAFFAKLVREVFPEPEFQSLPIFLLDLSAREPEHGRQLDLVRYQDEVPISDEQFQSGLQRFADVYDELIREGVDKKYASWKSENSKRAKLRKSQIDKAEPDLFDIDKKNSD